MEDTIMHMTLHFDGMYKDLKDDMDACQDMAKMLTSMFVGPDGSTDHTMVIIGDAGIDVFADLSNVDRDNTLEHLGEL